MNCICKNYQYVKKAAGLDTQSKLTLLPNGIVWFSGLLMNSTGAGLGALTENIEYK